MRVSLSKTAKSDLEAIDDYTIENFGLDQAASLTARFREAFRALAEMPRSGTRRPDISPPGRVFRCQVILTTFVVVYELADTDIRIARILHGARNLTAELEREPGDAE